MSETKYNVEVKILDDAKWTYWVQASSLDYAIHLANRRSAEERGFVKYRIRKVVKTIVWQEGKLREGEVIT